jgi:hypothetical protein
MCLLSGRSQARGAYRNACTSPRISNACNETVCRVLLFSPHRGQFAGGLLRGPPGYSKGGHDDNQSGSDKQQVLL